MAREVMDGLTRIITRDTGSTLSRRCFCALTDNAFIRDVEFIMKPCRRLSSVLGECSDQSDNDPTDIFTRANSPSPAQLEACLHAGSGRTAR